MLSWTLERCVPANVVFRTYIGQIVGKRDSEIEIFPRLVEPIFWSRVLQVDPKSEKCVKCERAAVHIRVTRRDLKFSRVRRQVFEKA